MDSLFGMRGTLAGEVGRVSKYKIVSKQWSEGLLIGFFGMLGHSAWEANILP